MTNDMIQLLVNTDQNLLLYLNGFHNAFGDYFMSTFTGKWIWVPMYASILYVLLKNFNWKITLCCPTAIALTILFADQVCASLDTPCRRTPATVQSGKSHLRPRPHCKQLPGRTLRLSILPCLQFFRTGILSGLPVPQTMAEPFHSFMGHAELLYAHLPGSALSGRPHSRCHHRMLRSSIHVLFT